MSVIAKEGVVGCLQPFPTHAIQRDSRGVLGYTELAGENVGFVVVSREGFQPEPADIRAFATTMVEDYKCPEFVAISCSPWPGIAAGKVDKRAVRGEAKWIGA